MNNPVNTLEVNNFYVNKCTWMRRMYCVHCAIESKEKEYGMNVALESSTYFNDAVTHFI